MAHESFESEEIADLLNNSFVSIKVDREERPDVDSQYMLYVQATTGGGGWPLSAFLTPSGKPFFGGTYFPPKDRYGQPGFAKLLQLIAERWKTDRAALVNSSERIIAALKTAVISTEGSSALPGALENVYFRASERAFGEYQRTFDVKDGGFRGAPKFPTVVKLQLLWALAHWSPDLGKREEAGAMLKKTLKAMMAGGIHDHIGGGFHRYSVDERWHVPHFEKMLYDQAQMMAIYASVSNGHDTLLLELIGYLQSNLMHSVDSQVAFYCAEDADSLPDPNASKKKEGAFAVWTEDEVDEACKIDKEAAQTIKLFYNILPQGNVDARSDPHGELQGKNVLFVNAQMEEPTKSAAEQMGVSIDDCKQRLARGQTLLRRARAKRPSPHLDDKIIVAWNGKMISGLCRAAMAMAAHEPFLRLAEQTASFLLSRMVETGQDGLIVWRSFRGSAHSSIPAFASDYAMLIAALLDLHETTVLLPSIKEQGYYLKMAAALQHEMDRRFLDRDAGWGYFTSEPRPKGQDEEEPQILNLKDLEDGAEPAANSVAAMNLARLALFFPEEHHFRLKADSFFAGMSNRAEEAASASPALLCAALFHYTKPFQITLQTGDQSLAPSDMIQAIHNMGPFKILVNREVVSGQETVLQICRGTTCLTPIRHDYPKQISQLTVYQ